MKKILALVCVFCFFGVIAFAQINVTARGGVQMLGNLHWKVGSFDGDEEMEMGIALAVEASYSVMEFVEVGGGVEYMLECGEVDDPDSKINFIPVYGLIRGKLPLGLLAPYAVGKVGYNLFLGNDSYTGGEDTIGGLYWSVGAGVVIMDLLLIEVAYTNSYGSIDVGSGYDVTYSHFDISAGITYTF